MLISGNKDKILRFLIFSGKIITSPSGYFSIENSLYPPHLLALTSQSVSYQIESILNNEFSSTTEQMDEAAKLIEDILIHAAQLCLRKKRSCKSKKSTRKRWFDIELYLKRRTPNHTAQKLFNNHLIKI